MQPRENPGPRTSWRWYALVAAPYIVGLIWLGTALRHNVGFPLDDSWIHQEIARNLVQFHTWGFTPGVPSSGSSSTLWTLLLASGYLLFPNASPVVYPLVLNSLLLIGCGLLLWRMAVRDGLPRSEALALAMLPGLNGNLAWLAFTGMEHILFVALSLLAILLWFRRRPSANISVYAGLALGALVLARPEGVVLCVLLLALYKRCGRSAADVLRAGAIIAVLIAPGLLLNLHTSGSIMPATMRGRRFLYTGSDKMHIGRSGVRALTTETYTRIISHHFFHSTGWWIALCVALSFYGVFVLLRRFPNRTAMLCVWAILHYACYCVALPAAGHGGRYQPFVLLLFPSLMAIALIDIARRVLPRSVRPREILQWAAVLLVGAITVATLPRWQVALRDSIFEINGSPRALAYWIDSHYPPGTKMAVSDIGAIGYFAHIDLIDLGGLVDPKFLSYLLSGRTLEYLDERNVNYIVIAHEPDDPRVGEVYGLLHNPQVRLVPIHTEAVDQERWQSGNVYTQHGARYQTLYRIEHVPPARQNAAATSAAADLAIHARPD